MPSQRFLGLPYRDREIPSRNLLQRRGLDTHIDRPALSVQPEGKCNIWVSRLVNPALATPADQVSPASQD